MAHAERHHAARTKQAEKGDTVKVNYTGKLDDGSVFDTSVGRGPLEFTIGEGQIIPGFEEAVVGMEPGQKRTVKVSPEEAYGARREDMVIEIEKSDLPDDLDPEVGQQLEMRQGPYSIPVTVMDVNDSSVTIDANHPLAGKDLTFEIELAEIR